MCVLLPSGILVLLFTYFFEGQHDGGGGRDTAKTGLFPLPGSLPANGVDWAGQSHPGGCSKGQEPDHAGRPLLLPRSLAGSGTRVERPGLGPAAWVGC